MNDILRCSKHKAVSRLRLAVLRLESIVVVEMRAQPALALVAVDRSILESIGFCNRKLGGH
ncbi:hypothetical protein F441_10361, partial [Phytophthora nicotianae CJ01A1]